MRRLAVLAACLAVLVGQPTAALAAAATAAEVRDLAGRALAGDAAALDRLRAVDAVDGRPVALDEALAGDLAAPGLQRRLETLAGAPAAAPAPPAAAADARAEAAAVLADERFREERDDGLVREALAAIGRALEPVGDLLAPLLRGAWLLLTVAVAATLLGLAAFLVVRARRQHAAAAAAREERGSRAARDPAVLERDADAAAARGDHELALRLRFEAGLVRLDHAGAIRLRESTTSGAVRSTLGPSRFDDLADAHDDVVYGGRPAAADDLAAARVAWPELLDEVRRR